MKQSDKIGIVTVLFNSETVVEEFLMTLNTQTYNNFTLYIVNNASPDKSLEVIQKIIPSVSYKINIFDEPENFGVAKGNNIGITAALKDDCNMILLSNNDVVLQDNTIEMLIKGMKEHNAPMVIPKIYFHGTNQIWAVGGRFDILRGATKHFGELEQDNGQYDIPFDVMYSPTCFMLIDRIVFDLVGLMDEKYFVYYDDTDFVWRATMKHKLKLTYIPKSILWHKESTCTGGQMSDFTVKYMARNSEYFIRKNFNFPYKQIAIVFKSLHTLLRKPLTMSKHHLKLVHQAEKEGKNLIKKH